jgi:nicotinamide-nucleotide amidase
MIPVFEDVFTRHIAPTANYFIYSRTFKLSGIGESDVDSRIADIYRKYRNPVTTILASQGEIELHFLGRSRNSDEEARKLTDELAEKVRARLNDYIFAEKDISLPEAIVEELKKRKLTLAVAESCSGGGLGNQITNVAGSSEVFLGGVIAYANSLKTGILGVPEEILKKHGAVSKQTAQAMAAGVRRLCGADIGLAITGIAGPGGATADKPKGLVYIHLCAEHCDKGMRQLFSGEREIVKIRGITYALNLVREYLKEVKGKEK